ncbi:hypothetical protein K438DRAFT_1822942 [Mycena galopus ATCC 62051]|nr:hypothetical protein K438DRAFT_1822942 [Mycena galopus ATCC 62051]
MRRSACASVPETPETPATQYSARQWAKMEGVEFPSDDEADFLSNKATSAQKGKQRQIFGGPKLDEAPHDIDSDSISSDNHGRHADSSMDIVAPESQRPVTSNFRRHDTLWFFDGSLFLQIHGVRFKLHRSRLRRASDFFEQVFAIREANIRKVCVKIEEVAGFDLYILDGMAEFRSSRTLVPFGVLASVVRAATTLRCESIRSWAIASIEESWTWSAQTKIHDPLPDVDACEILVLASTHAIPETVTARAFYELLRTQRWDKHANQLCIPKKALNKAQEQLADAWISIAADAQHSIVPCPFSSTLSVPPLQADSSLSLNDPEAAVAAAPLPRLPCISHSVSSVRAIHIKIVHALFEHHSFDPLGGLEALIAGEDVWAAKGYCAGCVHLRTKLWMGKKDKLMHEMNNVWFAELRTKNS